MYLRKALITITAAALVPILAPAQDLFRLSFHGHAKSINSREKVSTHSINAQDLIARCVGTNAFGTNQDYALVYNPTSDSVQVVFATNGAFICELFQFQGGITNSDGSHMDRFNFVFTPDETNAAGTAVIRQGIRNRSGRMSIEGQVQFVLVSLEPGSAGASLTRGATNDVATISSVVTTVPAPPALISDTSSLGLTNSTSTALSGDTAGSTLAFPPLPGLVTSPAVTSISNITDITNLTGGATVLSTPSAPLIPDNSPGGTLTNGLSALSTAGTNVLPGFSFTNGVICYGTFSGGKKLSGTP